MVLDDGQRLKVRRCGDDAAEALQLVDAPTAPSRWNLYFFQMTVFRMPVADLTIAPRHLVIVGGEELAQDQA